MSTHDELKTQILTSRVHHKEIYRNLVLQLEKDISSKKRTHLQPCDIIHLSNLDLTYIKNLERQTKLCLYSSTS
jgi:hypothetical protein